MGEGLRVDVEVTRIFVAVGDGVPIRTGATVLVIVLVTVAAWLVT
jgi:hypothetical protein